MSQKLWVVEQKTCDFSDTWRQVFDLTTGQRETYKCVNRARAEAKAHNRSYNVTVRVRRMDRDRPAKGDTWYSWPEDYDL